MPGFSDTEAYLASILNQDQKREEGLDVEPVGEILIQDGILGADGITRYLELREPPETGWFLTS